MYYYQVVLQGVGPDIILDDLSQLVGPSVSMVGEPGEETLWLLVLPLPPGLVLSLAGSLGQVLETEIYTQIHNHHKTLAYTTTQSGWSARSGPGHTIRYTTYRHTENSTTKTQREQHTQIHNT